MPASLLLSASFLVLVAQPPGDGLAPALPDAQPPQPGETEVAPFDDATEPSVGQPPPAAPANPVIEVVPEPPPGIDAPGVPVAQPAASGALAELIRNPYDIYDLREHVAVPAECLIARQACLPCTRTVTRCVPCGGSPCGGSATMTESLPVPGVNPLAAEELGQILLARTPNDPRVKYLMFVLRYRERLYEEAFGFLEEAVTLEQANPDAFPNYGEFMTPIQGRSRVYLERVRRLAGL